MHLCLQVARLSVALALTGAAWAAGDEGRAVGRVALFAASGFPAIDAPQPDIDALRAGLVGFELSVLDDRALPERLSRGHFDVVVLPYGSAFPKDAWRSIVEFLQAGGSIVNLGGAPFAVPVGRATGSFHVETRRPTYHRELGITQTFRVETRGLRSRVPAKQEQGLEALAASTPTCVHELTLRLTESAAFPDEDGSDGPRDAVLRSLVHLLDDQGVVRAASVVEIDRLAGRFAGGRWLLATGDAELAPLAVRCLVERALQGAEELSVAPARAGFMPGEQPALLVRYSVPRRSVAAQMARAATITLLDGRGRRTGSWPLPLAPVDVHRAEAQLVVPAAVAAKLQLGLHRVAVELPVRSTGPGGTRTLEAEAGFWRYTPAQVAGGPRWSVGRDYFRRDGATVVITGTSYMDSEVHRRFLLEPDPLRWERDFAAMAQAGVNLVRTGIWTGWSKHVKSNGEPTEEVLRALEVFVLTARRHNIAVVFTFFAFVPPSWGGVNPYLDETAVAAQKRFIGAFAGRLGGAHDIIWDLINEPSFSSPQRLWQCRPNFDAAETRAWRGWLSRFAGQSDSAALTDFFGDRWGSSGVEPLALPALADFGDKNLFGVSSPARASDFKRFAQDAFRGWVQQLSAELSARAGVRQLVTVGQDEGGSLDRPSPLLFGRDVDFTTTHTWWFNDALLWDAITAKLPDRPCLVEETGLMCYEQPSGEAWRSEAQGARLLERKLALALAGTGAGFVHWVWHVNSVMPSDNEVGIGLVRADGSYRPELDRFRQIASFLRRNEGRFGERVEDRVVVLVPHSQVMSARDLGTAATQRAVRVLSYELQTQVRAVSEYRLEELGDPALVIVPAPRMLSEPAWRGLLAAAEHGATVLVTGFFERDEVERPASRIASLGVAVRQRPVAAVEELSIGAERVAAEFRGNAFERVEAAESAGSSQLVVQEIPRGRGRLVWAPLPVELADGPAPTRALYARVLAQVELPQYVRVEPGGPAVLVRPLVMPHLVLLVIVNESSSESALNVTIAGHTIAVTVPAERSRLALFDRATGALIDSV